LIAKIKAFDHKILYHESSVAELKFQTTKHHQFIYLSLMFSLKSYVTVRI
jgi:hypothetical protein